MKMHELAPAIGSTKEAKRIGRGHGSGNGKTAGKGHKVVHAAHVFIGTLIAGNDPHAGKLPLQPYSLLLGHIT